VAPSDQLIIRVGDRVRSALPLNRSPFKIGRNPDNTLPLPNSMVSREHAELKREGQGWTLTDLQSANGTFVDGEKLLPNQPRLLAAGAVIRIGPFELIFQPAGSAAPDHADSPVQPVATPTDGHAPATIDAKPPDKGSPKPDQAEQGASPAAAPALGPATAEEVVAPQPPTQEQNIHSADRLCAPVAHPSEMFLPARDDDSRYLRYLPIIFQDMDLLRRYLLIFESILEPFERRQDHMELYIDSRTAPTSFLAWLASWIDVPISPHWAEERRRKLLTEATNLYRWRGTNYGLARMIEVCTGLTPTISDGDMPFVFHVRIAIPPGSNVDHAFIEDLIRTHKPAHAGYVLEVQS